MRYKLLIDANPILNQFTPLEIRINLIERIQPSSTQASYIDGILELYFDLQ
jgi:hypothetical protein